MRDAETIDVARTDWLPWACDESNVRADASPDETRQALYRRLERDDWLPSPKLRFAIDVLSAREAEPRPTIVEGSGAFIVAAENTMRAEVEAFAERFFEFSAGERAERLATLEARCRPFPPLRHRLRELRRGLKVEIPRIGYDRPVLDLAEHLAQLFVLGPEQRARRRRQPDDRLTKSLPQWREAAGRIRKHLPEVAALEPALIDSLTAGKVQDTRSLKQRIAPRRYSVWESIRANVSSLFETATESRWVLGVVVALAIRGCYLVGSEPSSSSSSPRYDVLKDPKVMEAIRKEAALNMSQQATPSGSSDRKVAGPQGTRLPEMEELDEFTKKLLQQYPPVAAGTGTGASSSLENEYNREMFRRAMVELSRRRSELSGKKSAYDAPPASALPGPVPVPSASGASPSRRNP